ncbi:MAG: 6,7-dimethyl-8-ribityllumazine synthase [Deltaproteobacteria bacterium]|nr:6,7-dimethyl-8-ribityllumazine synthase [Deltaproteobacteria bacterium]
MPKTLEGTLQAKGYKFGIVVSRFNAFITDKLLEGALDCLERNGADMDAVTIAKVPGAFEIPLACLKMAQSGQHDAVIALGAVIRGATPHFNYISSEVAKGIAQASLQTGVPIAFGIITSDTIEQAIERAGTKAGNKGWDAAHSAIEMVNLFETMGNG